MTVKTKRVLNRWFLVLLSVVLIVIISIFNYNSHACLLDGLQRIRNRGDRQKS